MNRRLTKRVRDKCITMSHSDGYLQRFNPEAVTALREAALTIQRLMDEVDKLKAKR